MTVGFEFSTKIPDGLLCHRSEHGGTVDFSSKNRGGATVIAVAAFRRIVEGVKRLALGTLQDNPKRMCVVFGFVFAPYRMSAGASFRVGQGSA